MKILDLLLLMAENTFDAVFKAAKYMKDVSTGQMEQNEERIPYSSDTKQKEMIESILTEIDSHQKGICKAQSLLKPYNFKPYSNG